MEISKLHESDKFDCPICHNDWFVVDKDEQGYSYAKPCECRAERMFIRGILNAGVKIKHLKDKTLDTFKVSEPWQKKMLDTAHKFLEDSSASGVGFFGKSGTGKTHISFAVMLELMAKGKKCLYFPYRNTIKRLIQSQYNDEEMYVTEMKKYSEVDVLFIDDLWKFSFDKEGNANKSELQIMYELINDRYINEKVTIFSSEYSTVKMLQIDEAVASRIYEMCTYGCFCEGKNQRYERRREC